MFSCKGIYSNNGYIMYKIVSLKNASISRYHKLILLPTYLAC